MPRPLSIMVNLLHAQRTLTGTGHYALNLVRAMLDLPEAPRIAGVCSAANAEAWDVGGHRNFRPIVWGHAWKSVMARRLEEWARLHAFVRREKPDVFFGPSNFLPLARACPYVATIHDMTFFEYPRALPPVRRFYWHRWTHRTIAVADAILTDTENAKAAIVRHGRADAARITVVPIGAGDEYFVANDATGRERRRAALRSALPQLPERYVLYVGTLTTHKNLPRLVEAVARARAAGCGDIALVLAGKRGEGCAAIADAVARTGLADRVIEPGYVAQELLPALYENARVAALPSLTEGFGLPIVEGMAAGVPVLTSDRGAMAEVAGGAAMLAHPEDADSIADALARLWTDDALRADLRARGIDRAAGFTWRACAHRTYDVLQRTAAAGR